MIYICIKENDYLDLFHNVTGDFYWENINVGETIDVREGEIGYDYEVGDHYEIGMIYYTTKDNILYIGTIETIKNYYGSFDNSNFKDYFISLAEYRNIQINELLK